jgi:aminomethyltransferase
MLNDTGGIIDDLIVYRIGEADYLVIVNCGNRTIDVEWLTAHREGETAITDISQGRSILAVQGPLSSRVLEHMIDAKVAGLGRFEIAPIRTMGPDACLARTGYTGGDGFELFLPDHHAKRLWESILASGAKPIGLGARDTLRVEAGLRLYGTDMDATTSPFEAGLDWTVAMNKPAFIGKEALVRQRQQGLAKRLVGFELSQGPVPRTGMELLADAGGATRRVGTVTSGTFSPILKRPLGMGYVEPAFTKPGTALTVIVRNQRYHGTVVKLPFWKGESTQPTLTGSNPPTKELCSDAGTR